MHKILQSGTSFRTVNVDDVTVLDVLPVQNYSVNYNSMVDQYSLEPIDNFTLPAKIYGDVTKHTKRILNTFKSRPNSTGVSLSGEKGSGKSLLAKNIAIEAQSHNIATIVINEPFCGDTFNKFIQSIECPTIVLFDEFEKMKSQVNMTKDYLSKQP